MEVQQQLEMSVDSELFVGWYWCASCRATSYRLAGSQCEKCLRKPAVQLQFRKPASQTKRRSDGKPRDLTPEENSCEAWEDRGRRWKSAADKLLADRERENCEKVRLTKRILDHTQTMPCPVYFKPPWADSLLSIHVSLILR